MLRGVLVGLLVAHPLSAQEPRPDPWSALDPQAPRLDPRADAGPTSDFWLPLGSVLLPGAGQYVHGAIWVGVAHTSAAVAGAYATRAGSTGERLPRDWRDQVAVQGLHVMGTAGFLSAWDAFHRSVANQRLGSNERYAFLQAEEDLGDLLTAPFDPGFLGRWTTWIGLAQSVIVSGYVVSKREDGVAYEPLRGHDPAFVGSLALNAAVGEEAAFRGWLLPLMTEKFGGRFWLANATQALIFGALHPRSGDYAAVITASAAYYGWQTRRNGWSVREAVFQHFWHNVMAGMAMLLTDERATVAIVSGRLAVP